MQTCINKFHVIKFIFPHKIATIIYSFHKFRYNPTRHLRKNVSKNLPRNLINIINNYLQLGSFARLPIISEKGHFKDPKDMKLLYFLEYKNPQKGVEMRNDKSKFHRLSVRDFIKIARKSYRTEPSPFDPHTELGKQEESDWYDKHRYHVYSANYCIGYISSFTSKELQVFLENDATLQKQFVYQLSQIFCSGQHSLYWGRIGNEIGNRLLCIVEKLLEYQETYEWVRAFSHEFAIYKRMHRYRIHADLLIRVDCLILSVKNTWITKKETTPIETREIEKPIKS